MIWKYWKSKCYDSVLSVNYIKSSRLEEKATKNIIYARILYTLAAILTVIPLQKRFLMFLWDKVIYWDWSAKTLTIWIIKRES